MEKHLRNLMFETNRIKEILNYDHSALKHIADIANTLRLADSAALKFASLPVFDDEIIQATRRISDLFREQEISLTKLLEPHKELFEMARKQSEGLRSVQNLFTDHGKLFHEVDFQALSSVFTLNAAASKVLSQIKGASIFDENEALAIRLMQPSLEYASFIDQTARKIRHLTDDTAGRALKASLMLTESQFIQISDCTAAVITPQRDAVSAIAMRALRVPKVQQMELLRSPAIDDYPDEEELFAASPAAKTASIAQGIIQMVTQSNDLCSLHDTEIIFKPTNRFIEAVSDFVWLLPTDRRAFADFIDCLYFIFYEGAGQNNLRYLQDKGGVLTKNDCSFIWCVKIFRNKWLRHDPEHGSPADIRYSRQQLLEQFRLLGLSSFPKTARDYRLLHQNLLNEASRFMETIIKGISEREG